jgi:hypothetical protein
MPLQPGAKLGPYEVVGLLGAGGMGEVYRARDTRLGREVAVKVLPRSVAGDPERQKRFEAEARAAGSINHPNIITLHDVGVHDGAPYLVTEVLEGQTLRQPVSLGPMAPASAARIVAQVALGLSAAHAKGIVHRDLKPENIFLLADGRVKILDFGIAKLTREENPATMETTPVFASLTQAGTILGTVSYMSPEQLRDRPVDHRADLFALGAILYEMVSGKLAFDGESAADRVTAILSADPAPIAESVEAALPGLGGLIRRCLEKRPETRFESARDLAYALEILTQAVRAPGAAIASDPVAAKSPVREVQQLTFRDGYVSAARFAPDGRTVFYHGAYEGGDPDTYFTRTDNLDYRPLQLGRAELLGVSSGAELAIGLDPRDVGGFIRLHTLARVSMMGGVPRELARDVYMADWAPDGKSLAAIREVGGRYRIEYPLGRVVHEVTGWMSCLRVSPDGRSLAFFEHPIGGDNAGRLMILEVGQPARPLVDDLSSASTLAWHPNGREVWFGAVHGEVGTGIIWGATLDGDVRVVMQTLGWPAVEDISSSGDLLVARIKPRLRLQTGTRSGAADPTDRVELSWLDWSLARDMTNDGRRALFDETGPGMLHMAATFVRTTDGAPAVRISDGVAMGFMPDEKHILTIDSRQDARTLAIHPLGAGEPLRIPLGDLKCHFARAFKDGRSVAVVGNYPGKHMGLYRVEIPSGKCTTLTEHPMAMTHPVLSPQGDVVLLRQPDGAFARFPVDGSPPIAIPGLEKDERPAGWTADGSAIFIFRRGVIPSTIERLDLVTGRREPWIDLEPTTRSGADGFISVCVTPDGERYIASYGQHLSELFVVSGLT